MTQQVECLIFDLFGTLVEYQTDRTVHDLTGSHQLLVNLCPDLSYDDYVQSWDSTFVTLETTSQEAGREFLMNEAATLLCESLNIQADQDFIDSFVGLYMQEWMTRVHPIPGVTGMLTRLSQHYRLALISNTHYPEIVTELIDVMSLGDVFQVVVTSAEFGKPKPHPEIFAHTLSKLNIEPASAVYIGDSYEHDYQGATRAGMDCFLIGKHARISRDRQLRSILDLPIHFKTDRSK